jgi:hypothetical protein
MKKLNYTLISLLLLSTLILAAPTIYGPTGLIEMPTADSLQYKEFNIGLDYNIAAQSIASQNAAQYYYKFNLGTFKGIELGLVGGSVPTEGVFINLKYYLMSDNSRYPISIAIGIENVTSISRSSAYLVASKKFQGGLHGHFGFKAFIQENQLDSCLMLGGEYFLSDEFSIASDIIGEGRQYKINGGLRYYFADDLFFRASVVDVTDSQGNGVFYNVGVSWSRFL